MSDTPRTDALIKSFPQESGITELCASYNTLLDHARKLERESVRLQKTIREMAGDARDAAVETRWQERQGDEYGSY